MELPPRTLSAAEARVDALDTWHDWAGGKPVTQESLVEAVTTLHEIAVHEPDNGTRQLANVIHQWAEQHGVELARPPLQQRRTIETGIEIDLVDYRNIYSSALASGSAEPHTSADLAQATESS